jgi:hypothetical protein
MFCYPTGCRLHRAKFSDAPLAEYYGFVVKNERGDSIYVSCVSFAEPLTAQKQRQLDKLSETRRHTSLAHAAFCDKRDKQNQNENYRVNSGDSLLTRFDDMTTFEKKTICLVSRFPFWTAFRKFLSHLHILSGSTSELPLERHISHLLLSVPLPKPGGPRVIVSLPAFNDPMVLHMPPEKDFPLVDLPFQRIFACLEIKKVVTIVLGLLALERKVILMSIRPSLVLDACELLRALLFPFDLCAPYVPRLTEPFKSSLEFPGALFVGIHRDGSPRGLAEVVRRTPPEDSIIVDLDTGEIDCDGDCYQLIAETWDLIPKSARAVLVSELQTLCRDANMADGQEPLDSQYDSAFDVSLHDAVEDTDLSCHSQRGEELDDRAIRDAFLRFFCAVLGGYERFLVVPDADFLTSGNEWFDTQGFLGSVPSERAPYLSVLVSTQLFQSFIQRRTEASDIHCLLFDECMLEFHSSLTPYGRLGGDVEAISTTDSSQPHMLFSLLVDQSAALPFHPDPLALSLNRSMDASEAESSLNVSRVSYNQSVAEYSVKHGESVFNHDGDFVTAPTQHGLPTGRRFSYCVDGSSCFPHKLSPDLFLPVQPESWLIETSKAPNPLLARSERELEDANRRRRMATSFKNQRRCLWQLPKLMGSEFLGAWLLCIPVQVSQKNLLDEHQTQFLMRALGALRLVRSKQRIVPDEAAYRALMVACGRAKSDRRLELVKLFGLLRSDGIFPSAVTLGQYTRALAEGYSKRSDSTTLNEHQGGVKVTASVSKSKGSINSVCLPTLDLESRLSSLDTTLADLETHGRRWRQRAQSHGESEEYEKQKQRNSNKTWLPVVLSTSLVPSCDGDSSEVKLLAMWSRTRGCPTCKYIPLDEEVQAGWDVVGGENEIPGAVACPRCGSLVIPFLGYKEMSMDDALALESQEECADHCSGVADFKDLPPQIRPTVHQDNEDESYVAYISPAALRLALEHYVEEYGEDVLSRERLKALDPEVFYNLWWYCARFSLPFPLPVFGLDSEKPSQFFAFAAWDRSSAERGCWSAAKVIKPLLDCSVVDKAGIQAYVESFDDLPLLSRFNLQGYFSTVWDHVDLSNVSWFFSCALSTLHVCLHCRTLQTLQILVNLVAACDNRDFTPVSKFVSQIVYTVHIRPGFA